MAVLTGFIRTPAQFYLARFVLGLAEAGFFPGVIVYLSHWFRQRDRAKAVAMFKLGRDETRQAIAAAQTASRPAPATRKPAAPEHKASSKASDDWEEF